MDIDKALHSVGEYGRLQRRVLWSMAIPQIFVAWQHIQNVFTGAEPRLYCIREGTGVSDGCPKSGELPCKSYAYPDEEFTSIASEWDLVCGKAYKSDVVQSFYMAGLLVGNLLGGIIADQYGRRRIVYQSCLAITVLCVFATFTSSYEWYVTWRFLSAVCTGAYGLVSFTLPTELVGAEQRGFVNLMATISYALGIASLSGVAYFVRDWRAVSIVTALPGLIGLYYYRSVPESPRWLLSQGRVDEAETVLNYIATVNSGGRAPAHPVKLQPVVSESRNQGSGSFLDLLRHTALCRITINNVFTWFVTAMGYYGLTLRAGTLGSNRYTSMTLAGLIEIPADLATLWTIEKYGRRWTYSWSLFCGGLACVVIAVVPAGMVEVSTMLAFLGKMCISVSFCVCWIHATEMYPTSIRNKALSVCNMSSRLGGVVAPLVLTLGRLHQNADFLLFGAFTLVAALVSRLLPETRNRPMLEVVDDVDRRFSKPGSGLSASQDIMSYPTTSVEVLDGKVPLLGGLDN